MAKISDEMTRILEEASAGLKALEEEVIRTQFDPDDPASVQSAIDHVEHSIDAKIAPTEEMFGDVDRKGRIRKVWKLLPVGASFAGELIALAVSMIDEQLQVVAVGGDERYGEPDRFVIVCPMEGRFEDNLLGWIAHGFVEPGCGFGSAKDVHDPVIADAITGAELEVSVVIECAPAKATGIQRTRCELVMYTRMTNGVLAQPLKAVDGLRRKGVAYELCI